MFSSVARRAMPIDSNTLQMRRSSKASRPRRSARTTQILGETTGASITRKRAASRPIFERDGAGDAVILVMLEDDKTRLRRQAARQSRALIEDSMAVALLVGGDAGVGGYVANGIGQDDLQRDGEAEPDV